MWVEKRNPKGAPLVKSQPRDRKLRKFTRERGTDRRSLKRRTPIARYELQQGGNGEHRQRRSLADDGPPDDKSGANGHGTEHGNCPLNYSKTPNCHSSDFRRDSSSPQTANSDLRTDPNTGGGDIMKTVLS